MFGEVNDLISVWAVLASVNDDYLMAMINKNIQAGDISIVAKISNFHNVSTGRVTIKTGCPGDDSNVRPAP